jgi:flagellar basal-body rod protein FlgB
MSGRLFDPVLSTLSQSLNLRMQQHGLSTSNIANSETPQYRARRLDFEAAFDKVLNAASEGEKVDAGDVHQAVDEIDAPAWSEDGNSVNPDEEMSVMVTNNMLFNATVEVMNRRLAMLEYAATDGGK